MTFLACQQQVYSSVNRSVRQSRRTSSSITLGGSELCEGLRGWLFHAIAHCTASTADIGLRSPHRGVLAAQRRSWQGSVLYLILGIRSVNERLSLQVLFDLGKLQSQLSQPGFVDKQLAVAGVEMRDDRAPARCKSPTKASCLSNIRLRVGKSPRNESLSDARLWPSHALRRAGVTYCSRAGLMNPG